MSPLRSLYDNFFYKNLLYPTALLITLALRPGGIFLSSNTQFPDLLKSAEQNGYLKKNYLKRLRKWWSWEEG